MLDNKRKNGDADIPEVPYVKNTSGDHTKEKT